MAQALKQKPIEAAVPATAKVHQPFADPSAADSARRPATLGSGQRLRRRVIRISFLLAVALPTLIVASYYAFMASDQYASETRFAVRSATTVQNPDLLGLISGGGASGTIADAYVVIDFVRSRQILDLLSAEIDTRAIFARREADWWARLDPTLAMEDVIVYWRRMVSVGFDTTSQIMTIQVRAFTRDDALKLTTAILRQSEQLINDLSARSRADAVKMAEQEVERMEGRLRTARLALRTFREERQELDPRKKAEARQQIIETLQSELTTARAKLQAQRQQMSEAAPSVVYQVNLIKALETQIDAGTQPHRSRRRGVSPGRHHRPPDRRLRSVDHRSRVRRKGVSLGDGIARARSPRRRAPAALPGDDRAADDARGRTLPAAHPEFADRPHRAVLRLGPRRTDRPRGARSRLLSDHASDASSAPRAARSAAPSRR